MNQTNLRDYVASNPKTIGALFTLALLLSQAGTALGTGAAINPGP